MSDRLDEFSKFVRFFTVRLTQTLVQARLGSKIENSCSVDSDQTCWFNVKVDELGEIAAYLRNAIKKKLSVDDDIDALVNVRTDLYHQLGTLLRSAAVAARMTPMYRYYVKKQSHDTFVILYRIYEGEPSADLGDESKHNRIGYLPSPYGSICLDLTFRTQMEIPNREILVVDPVHLNCLLQWVILCVSLQLALPMYVICVCFRSSISAYYFIYRAHHLLVLDFVLEDLHQILLLFFVPTYYLI
uniref:Autophagy-related protein 13 n=1 Tax=Heterorhabditis bacteriophora TaxID=37862 RepID=A0A1I7WJM5_HETBA